MDHDNTELVTFDNVPNVDDFVRVSLFDHETSPNVPREILEAKVTARRINRFDDIYLYVGERWSFKLITSGKDTGFYRVHRFLNLDHTYTMSKLRAHIAILE